MIQRYASKISGPLLDRIDIHIDMPAVRFQELRQDAGGEGSEAIRNASAHDRILKMARTIADLEGAEDIASGNVSEAIQYRSLDRSYWS